jgi:hypothetical protein
MLQHQHHSFDAIHIIVLSRGVQVGSLNETVSDT